MGTEPVEELPDDLEAWVAERAAAADTSRADVVRRLMAAHRLLDEHPDRLDDVDAALDAETGGTNSSPGIDDLDARVDDLAGRVGELEADLDEKITDVRQRVIQVKREADAKAPGDHDHPSIERRIDEGFDNYEEILEYLTDQTEALEDEAKTRNERLRSVANAVVDLRRRVSAIEGAVEERAAATELREAANRRGISEAACGSCGESVHLGLLDRPTCPHCGSPFDGVEAGGWFNANRLTVGDRPALESGADHDTAAGGDGPAAGSNGPGSSTAAGADGAGRAGDDASGLSNIVDDGSDGSDGSDDEPTWVPDLGSDGAEDEATGDDAGGSDAAAAVRDRGDGEEGGAR